MGSKRDFLEALRKEIRARYLWAADEVRLSKFMLSAEHTIYGVANTWNKDGDAATAAWRAIGGKGKPTYKALRELEN
jgi:hypothetical protein